MEAGTRFQAVDKLITKTEWLVNEIKNNGYFILSAIGNTLKRYENDLQEFKRHNGQYESVRKLSLDEFAQIEVEPEWFNHRRITLL